MVHMEKNDLFRGNDPAAVFQEQMCERCGVGAARERDEDMRIKRKLQSVFSKKAYHLTDQSSADRSGLWVLPLL